MSQFTGPRTAIALQTGLTTAQSAKFAGGRVKSFVEEINLSTINGGSAVASGDTLRVGVLPKGAVFLYGHLSTTVTLGSSQLAIGDAGSAARFRAAAVLTATATVEVFAAAAGRQYEAPADTPVVVTVSAANLPTTDNTVRIEIFYTDDSN